MDRAFTILYDDDLERQWTLRDEEGNRHVVTYNKNLQKPMLIGGWTKLGTYMNFTISTLFILDMSVILASTSLFFPVNANLCLLHVFLKELRQINPFQWTEVAFLHISESKSMQCQPSGEIYFIFFTKWMFISYFYLCFQIILKI